MCVRSIIGMNVVAALLGACGAGSGVETRANSHAPDDIDIGETQQSSDDDAEPPTLPPTVLPPTAPRWVAVWTRDDSELPTSSLSVVRFDDPGKPETFALASGADELVSQEWVFWSPEGTHVAFLTCDRETLMPSLFVASASDDFERRPVSLEFEPTNDTGCRDFNTLNSISWMGADTLFAAVLSGDQKLYHRVGISTLEPELLGAISFAQPFTTSEFGALYVLGTPEESWDLWFATEAGEPRRLGTKPDALLFSSGGPLTWAPDGQSATWWTQWPADSSSPDAATGSGNAAAPPFEVVPNQLPKIGRVHVPTGLVVDRHPKGDLSTSYDFQGMAISPHGSAIAYAIYRRSVASIGSDQRITLIRGDSSVPISGGIGSPVRQILGFLDEERFYYSSGQEPQDPDGDRTVTLFLRTGADVRELSVDRYAPDRFDAFRNHNRLFFARESVDRWTSLWTVDLDDPTALAEQVSIEGSVVGDSILKQGQVQPLPYHDAVDAELGQALLLASSDDSECRTLQRGCQTARWIVNLEAGVEVIQLHDAWVDGIVSWTPDGSGLIAVSQSGLSFIPGPEYRGSVAMKSDVVAMVLPTRWPRGVE